MSIEPRKVAMWQFFNDNVEASAPARLGRLDELSEGNRDAARLFIDALKGCRRVLDIGCGTGIPLLYVAPHVGEVVGVDAAPNMVSAARANASRLGLTNASFAIAGAEGLPFEDQAFDGVSMLGVLESMDWDGVHRAMTEAQRVLAPGGRLVALDRDWRHVLRTQPTRTISIRRHERGPVLQVMERLSEPACERDTRYLVAPESPTGAMLAVRLGDKDRVTVEAEPVDLGEADVLDAWYDEGAQFDAETFAELARTHGFGEVHVASPVVWNEPVLFLTARRRTRGMP